MRRLGMYSNARESHHGPRGGLSLSVPRAKALGALPGAPRLLAAGIGQRCPRMGLNG